MGVPARAAPGSWATPAEAACPSWGRASGGGFRGQGPGSSSARRAAGHLLAMPQGLLWVCLAVWEARGDLPFIAQNDAALMVNW